MGRVGTWKPSYGVTRSLLSSPNKQHQHVYRVSKTTPIKHCLGSLATGSLFCDLAGGLETSTRRIMHAPIVIPMEDEIIHTALHPSCDDETCPCHRILGDANGDPALTEATADPVSKGEESSIQDALNPHE